MDLNWNIKLMGQRIINFNGKNWMNLELSSDSKIRKTETEKLYKRTIELNMDLVSWVLLAQ